MDNIKWLKLPLGIISMTIVVVILRELRTIFMPLTFAVFLTFIFAPLNAYLYRHKIPKMIVIVLMVLIIFLFFALVGFVIYVAINSFVVEFPKYQALLVDMVNESYISFQQTLLRFETIFSKLPDWLGRSQIISSGNFSVTRVVTGTMGSFFDFLVKLFMTLIFLVFIVAGIDRLGGRVKKVLTESRNKQTVNMINNIQIQMKRYFISKTLISMGTAVVGMSFVLLFGVDFVIVTGILLFVLNFIPNIGSFIASGFPILICFLQYGFGWRLIGLASCLTLTQLTFGNIIEPNIMGERLNLSPVVVLISLIFWGWVWGITGMIISVPFTSAINIILKEIDENNIISAIISDT